MAHGSLRVDKYLLPGLEHLCVLALVLVLVKQGRRDIGFEDASAESEDEEADEKRRDALASS